MYMVIDCNNEYININVEHDIRSRMITSFETELNIEGLRVVVNYKAETSIHYLANLPRRSGHIFFKRRIHEYIERDGDDADTNNMIIEDDA